MKRVILWILMIISLSAVSSLIVWLFLTRTQNSNSTILSPILKSEIIKPKPLLAYSIPHLASQKYQPSQITLEKVIDQNSNYTSYLFSYQTLGKKMTGQLNIPSKPLPNNPTIVMLRGYVPPEMYTTGVGTRNAAAFFAEHGFMTAAPDFFSYGGSDPEPEDPWQARFQKPVSVAELIATLRTTDLVVPALENQSSQTLKPGKIGIWGHSNGGQIALTTLEIIGESIPTTLWAPVTAPFPYSLLYFSDENSDEGKEMRKWIALFEADYDVFDFSLTQHLHLLHGPLQIHHGTNDDAALKFWSDEFTGKIEIENQKRADELKKQATLSALIDESRFQKIDVEYFVYPGANHNLQPGWQTVVERDLLFFQKHLSN